jgi:hypothetical protein
MKQYKQIGSYSDKTAIEAVNKLAKEGFEVKHFIPQGEYCWIAMLEKDDGASSLSADHRSRALLMMRRLSSGAFFTEKTEVQQTMLDTMKLLEELTK